MDRAAPYSPRSTCHPATLNRFAIWCRATNSRCLRSSAWLRSERTTASRSASLFRRSRIRAHSSPPAPASRTIPSRLASAAWTGRRLAHLPRRSQVDDRRARIGRPSRNRPRSSARSVAPEVPATGPLLQALQADRLEVARQAGSQGPWRGRVLFRHQAERLQIRLATEAAAGPSRSS